MRNANTENPKPTGIKRATFEVPRDLHEAFMETARSRDLNGSQAMRRLMRDYVEQERRAA